MKGAFYRRDRHEKPDYSGVWRIAGRSSRWGGEIPLELQVKLLRVLQEQEFRRTVGSTRTMRVNVRIAATNRDLGQMVENKKFAVTSLIPPRRVFGDLSARPSRGQCRCSSGIPSRNLLVHEETHIETVPIDAIRYL